MQPFRFTPRRAVSVAVALLFVFAGAGAAHAQEKADSLTLSSIVRIALERNPNVHLAREERRRLQGQRVAASGAFDATLGLLAEGRRDSRLELTGQGRLAGPATEDGMTYRLDASKQLRMGVIVTPHLQAGRSGMRGASLTPQNRMEAGVELTYPLLRGRGAQIAEAREQAAALSHQSARFEEHATLAETALQTTEAYWAYVAAEAQHDIAATSEERAATLLEQTEILVDNDERPAAALDQLRANLGDKRNRRLQAWQGVVDARQQLGLVMGLTREQTRRMAIARRPLPEPPDTILQRMPQRSVYVARAMQERNDIKAAHRRQSAAEDSREAARHELKPRLDLSVGADYAGWVRGQSAERLFSPFDRTVNGPSLSITLSTSLSARNRTARGQVAAREALYQQRRVQVLNLERSVRIQVHATVDAFRNGVYRYRETEQSTRWHRSVVENQQQMYRLGEATLIDVIVAQDRLDQALISHVRNRQLYAASLVRLRFQTGTLLHDDPPTLLHSRRLLSLPSLPSEDTP